MVLYVLKGERFDQDVFGSEILRRLYATFGEDTEITVKFVDRVPMIRTGKQQGSISTVEFDFQKVRMQPHDMMESQREPKTKIS